MEVELNSFYLCAGRGLSVWAAVRAGPAGAQRQAGQGDPRHEQGQLQGLRREGGATQDRRTAVAPGGS